MRAEVRQESMSRTAEPTSSQVFGPAAADQFLAAYLEAADGFAYNPYWDVDSLLDVCLPQPSFYGPWQEFGLSSIAPEALRQRVDAYLERVMRRT